MTPASHIDLSECLQEHAKFITRTLRIYEHNPAICDELFQDVALALWRALPSYRGDAALRTFIARIVHNIAVSHVRKASRYPRQVSLDDRLQSDTPSPEHVAEANSQRAKLLAAIRTLPLKSQQVLSFYLEDFSPVEMAEILGISEGNTAVRLTRARKHLAIAMEAYK